jgi:hypothetical protein
MSDSKDTSNESTINISTTNNNNNNSSAAPPQSASQSSSWLGSFWQTVKTQSEAVLDVYKRDLSEFSQTIANDTHAVAQRELAEADGSVSKTVHTTLSNAVSSISAVISNVVDAANADADESSDKGDKKNCGNVASAAAPVVSAASDLSDDSIEFTEAFYRADPSAPDDLALFLQWKESSLALADKTDEISRVLAEKEHLRSFHAKLVPDPVPYRDFWARYFYRVHKVALAKRRRDELVRRVSAAAGTAQPADDLTWDDDDDAATTPAPAPAVSSPVAEPPAPSPVVVDTVPAPIPVPPAPVAPTPAPVEAAVAPKPAPPAAAAGGEEDWGDWE